LKLKRIIAVVLVVASILAMCVVPVSACPVFEGTVDISGNTNIMVGESTTLTADWTTNIGVTRGEWFVDGVGQGVENTGGCAGSSSMTFSSETEGSYVIAFAIWHHTQPGRYAIGVTVVTVSKEEPPPPPPPPPPKPVVDSLNITFGLPWGGDVTSYDKKDGTWSDVLIVGYFSGNQYAIKIPRGTLVKDSEGKTPPSVWFNALVNGVPTTAPSGITFSQPCILYKITGGTLYRAQNGDWVGGQLVEVCKF
jgi:hypothetical protein